MEKILIVEDELDIQELLVNFLESAGYEVCVAGDGIQALDMFHRQKVHLILLDIMLPKIDGYGVLELIRKESQVPVVMVTALDSEQNQIKGFDLLVDDYITKPFSMDLLLRKIAAVLRRSNQTAGEGGAVTVYRDLRLHPESYQVFVHNREVILTRKEFELLALLLQNQGKVFARQALLDSVWSYDYFGDERVVDTHIKNIRKKTGVDYITTIRGVGYRVDKENKK